MLGTSCDRSWHLEHNKSVTSSALSKRGSVFRIHPHYDALCLGVGVHWRTKQCWIHFLFWELNIQL